MTASERLASPHADGIDGLIAHIKLLREVNEQLLTRLLQAHDSGLEAERLKAAAELASDVQRTFLSPVGPIPGLNLYARMSTYDYLGGDFYDVVQAPGQVTVVVGDAMGKGVPAALMMVMALSQFREAVRADSSPSKILATTNQRLCEILHHSGASNLVTGSVLTIDLPRGRVRYAQAGHEGLLVCRTIGGCTPLHAPPGLVLGVQDELYRDASIAVVPGDILMLFTDGISEARNRAGDFFGTERLADLVKHRTEPDLQRFGDQIVAEVQRFVGGDHLQDDAVLLLIEISG